MVTGLPLLFIITIAIIFIVIVCTRFKWHPFLALLVAAILTGITSGIPLADIATAANEGFGNMMTHIGMVVVLGTMIGTILEKSGATLRIADAIIRLFGKNKPVLAITIIGAVVGVPIFCDSGFVILNGLTKALSMESKKSYKAIVNGLAGGLYITHTLLPPHPGALAGAANLGLGQHLGNVLLTGLAISVPATLVCWLFASKFLNRDSIAAKFDDITSSELVQVPSLWKSVLPIIVPVLMIALGSMAGMINLLQPLKNAVLFFGSPLAALLTGLVLSLLLIKKKETKQFNQWMIEAISNAGPILILVGAGGVFGSILKKTPLADLVQQWVSSGHFSPLTFLFIAWAIGCLLKTAQGSTTSAIIVSTSILSPIAFVAGFSTPLSLSLLLAATSCGAMMVSHANDAYFWVIAQFSGLGMQETYRSFSLMSIVLSITCLIMVLLLAFLIL
ncbi:MAG: GntP family permease [Mucilaginibacter sp.]